MPAHEKKSRLPAPSGFLNSFRISKVTPKRARFGLQRRQEVKAVRDCGACLRCRLLKIKCSESDRCTTCAELIYGHEKQTMSFSGCVRTKLTDVSIFGKYAPKGDIRPSMMQKSKALALSCITLSFASDVTWDLDVLVKDIAVWLRDPTISKTSKVGILSSPNFLGLIKSSGGKVIDQRFQIMIYATSLAYTQPTEPPLDTKDIYSIGCIAGYEFLNILEDWLKPQSLQKCSLDDLRALFLMVFGTILSVGYCCPSSDQEGPEDQSHDSRDMHNHICQILAHYILYLGSRLSLPIESGIDQFILEAASSRWHKKGIFDWRTVKEDEKLDELNFDFDFGALTDEFEIQLGGYCGWDQVHRSWQCHVPENPVKGPSANVNMSLDDMPFEIPQWLKGQGESAKVGLGSWGAPECSCGNMFECGFRKHPKMSRAAAPASKPTYRRWGSRNWPETWLACHKCTKEPYWGGSNCSGKGIRVPGQVAENARQIPWISPCCRCWELQTGSTPSSSVGESCKTFGEVRSRGSRRYDCVIASASSILGHQLTFDEFCFVPDDWGAQLERPVKEFLLV